MVCPTTKIVEYLDELKSKDVVGAKPLLQQVQQAILQKENEQLLLGYYNRLFSQYYEVGYLKEALYFLEGAEKIVKHTRYIEEKIAFMQNCIRAAIFTNYLTEMKEMIQRDIGLEQLPVLLGLDYQVLSIISVQEGAYELAAKHAKMALFYAEILEESEQQSFLRCNAELQLIFSLCYVKDAPRIKQYVKLFQWYIEQCKNDQEKIIVLVVEASLAWVEQRIEEGAMRYKQLLQQLLASREVMYSTYITQHIQQMLRLFQELIEPSLYEELQQMSEQVHQRFSIVIELSM